MQAAAGFVFGEKTLMDGFAADVVDQVGHTGKVGIEARHLQIVVYLVEEIAEGGGIAVAGANLAGERRGELLLDGLLKNRAAQDGAGSEEAKEIAAGGFVEITIGLL